MRGLFPRFLLAAAALAACSPRAYVASRAADALSRAGAGFAAEDDLELAREAAPFALKAMEALLEEQPGHRGLLEALCRGFTQYAAAFVRQQADEEPDVRRAADLKERMRRLCLRARDFGLRGLEAAHPGFTARFAAGPAEALSVAVRADVPLLYFTGLAWSLAISAAGDDPALLAGLPRCEALLRRALVLWEDFDAGAIHEFFIAFEGGRPAAMGGSIEKARAHFERAEALSAGRRISPFVTYAEVVLVRLQDRRGFLEMLDRALALDARRGPAEYRLANLIAQRRARWLKERVDALFLE